MKHHRVLVTGSAGAVGRAVCQELLSHGHFVRGFDLRDSPHASESRVGSIHDASAVDDATVSMNTLIHLAAEPNDCDFMSRLLPSNVVGVYNVMDAARKHNVRRVALASSGQVISGQRKTNQSKIRVEDGTSPTNHYAVTKVFAEAMGHMYAHRFDMSVVAVRIGWLTRNPEEAAAMKKWGAFNSFLSHRDVGRFFACCVEAEGFKYAVVFATSKQTGDRGVDLTPAREILGYEPMDEFPQGLPFEVE